MKKISYLFIAIISFIGINSVNADTLIASSFYDTFDNSISAYFDYENVINNMISYYEENYQSDYPYYLVLYYGNSYSNYFELVFSDSNETYWSSNELWPHYINAQSGTNLHKCILYSTNSGDYSYSAAAGASHLFRYGNNVSFIYGNQVLINHGFVYKNTGTNSSSTFDTFSIPSFTSSSFDFSVDSFDIVDGDNFPSFLDLYNGTYERNMFDHYTEINLNNYAYVALSLKDYTLRNDNINQFSTNIYTKGQLCLTPVYDYGMNEKSDYYNGYQVDRCSVVYDDFTSVRTYILKQDLENNAIYYLKAYDTSIENKVKVDTNIFNISYITLENADNPSVNVNGRNYPTIAYNDLTSSSTQSEEEGYVSGQAVNVIDQFDENFISNFFSNPLNVLKSVWGAIVSILSLIATFIALLPVTLQGFLYMSFALAIILGIIKILL